MCTDMRKGDPKDSLEGLYVLVTIASRNWVCVNFSCEGAPDQSILGHQKPTVVLKADEARSMTPHVVVGWGYTFL